MHALPVDDFFAKGRVREDGRLLHDFFLAEVKAPSESIAPWDYYKIRRIIPAQEAAQPLSTCAQTKLRSRPPARLAHVSLLSWIISSKT